MSDGYFIDNPDYPSPHRIDDTLFVADDMTIVNDIGETITLPPGRSATRVKITDLFWDYTEGWIYEATLLETYRRKKAEEAGTTKYTPEFFKSQGEERVEFVRQAKENFDPYTVRFSEFADISLESTATKPRKSRLKKK